MFTFALVLLLSLEACLSLSLSEVAYTTRTYTGEGDICSGYSIKDTVTVSVTTEGRERGLDVSLYIRHPMESGQWVRAGVNQQVVRFKSCYPESCHTSWFRKKCRPASCHYSVELRKERVGYEVLKPAGGCNGCDPQDVTRLPFSLGKYGEPELQDIAGRAEYMLVVGDGTQSVSERVGDKGGSGGWQQDEEMKEPDGEMKEPDEEMKEADGEKMEWDLEILEAVGVMKELEPSDHDMKTSSLKVLWFNHYPYFWSIYRLFICTVRYRHLGTPLNLSTGIVSHSVSFYYRPTSSSAWGTTPFLYGNHYQYSGGVNRYYGISWSGILALQGINVNTGCFRCEATVNGITDTRDTGCYL